jgi:hypothetical protein
MLDCYIPVMPSSANTEFAIFASKGSGYYPTPSGPMCIFVSREQDELVPINEIAKSLRHLRISDTSFWEGIPDTPFHQAGNQ